MILLESLPIHFDISHIHPSMVHFPVALILAGYLIFCIYMFRKRNSRKFALLSYYVLMSAALCSFVIAFTGLFYTDKYPGVAMNVLIDHRFWAMLTVIFIGCAAAFKLFGFLTTKKNVESYNWPTFIFYSLASFCVIVTATRGVQLAFVYLMGPQFQP